MKGEPVGVGQTSNTRLLNAALTSFSERGYHGTTTRDITAAAGLSPGALYIHYKSKAEMLFQIIKDTHTELLESMEEAYASHLDPAARLTALVTVHVRFHAHRITETRVANQELAALSGQRRGTIVKQRRRIEKLVEKTIKEGIGAQQFRNVDARATTFAILSMGIGVSRWFRPQGQITADELAEIYSDLSHQMLTSYSG